MTFERRTVSRSVEWSGMGLHSGLDVRVTVLPFDGGIAFCYEDMEVLANPLEVVDTRRCTKVGKVSTVEHLMAAFAGLEITDARVEVRGAPELPALDGSANLYCHSLLEAGVSAIGALESPPLFARIFVKEAEYEIAISKGTGHWSYTYESPGRWPEVQEYETLDVVADFASEIAPSRTFAHEDEIEALQQAGLGQGLDERSVLILGRAGYANEPRFPNEAARHKLLDLMGDLYLSGVPLRSLNVSAVRSGHTANVRAATMLREAVFSGRAE